jgi:phytanoyl-CoA hydroxylase
MLSAAARETFWRDWFIVVPDILTADEVAELRLEPVPVRLPLPPALHQGSIHENRRATQKRFFATAAKKRIPAAAE